MDTHTRTRTHTHTQVGEVLRGVRAHYTRFIDGLAEKDFRAAQLGLAHAYSRSKVCVCVCVCMSEHLRFLLGVDCGACVFVG